MARRAGGISRQHTAVAVLDDHPGVVGIFGGCGHRQTSQAAGEARRRVTVSVAGATPSLVATALKLPEEWARAHPEEAKGYIATRFKLDPAYVESMWWRTQLAVTLPQELLTALDSEARWLDEQDDSRDSIPNYSQFIRPDELLSVKPAAVTLLSSKQP